MKFVVGRRLLGERGWSIRPQLTIKRLAISNPKGERSGTFATDDEDRVCLLLDLDLFLDLGLDGGSEFAASTLGRFVIGR